MSESPREIGPRESSRFREVVLAGLRAKQLLRGSKPRIEPHPDKAQKYDHCSGRSQARLDFFYATRSVEDSPIHY
jgi:hypothetical protein